MEAVLNKIIESLENGNILLVVALVAAAIIFNTKKIVDFFDDRRKLRIDKINEALKSDYLRDNTRKHLENEIEAEYFKLATGIYLEKSLREKIIETHQKANGELGFRHFKRAMPHIQYKSKSLIVNISNFEKFLFYFNRSVGAVLGFLGLVLTALPGLMKGLSLLQFILLLGQGFFLVCIAVFLFWQTYPIISAKKIEEQLNKPTGDIDNKEHPEQIATDRQSPG